MSEITATTLANRARDAAIAAVWAQWGVLNPRLLGTRAPGPVTGVIDLEALVLASLVLWDEERRLVDVLAWWAAAGGRWMSARRVDTLRRAFPASASGRLGTFGGWTRAAGDSRWKADATEPVAAPRPEKGPEAPTLDVPATLLLRLRAAFGVSAKADVLAYLIALGGRAATPRDIVRAVGYADKNVRVAARDLALAGFVAEHEGRPVEYAIEPAMARGLAGEATPAWKEWAAVFPFVLTVASWDADATLANAYVLSSRARDLFLHSRSLFRRTGLRVPDPKRFPGEAFLPAFSETLDALVNWLHA